MKSINFLVALILAPFSFFSYGQDLGNDKPIKRISVSDVYVSTGFGVGLSNQSTLDDFKKLAPQSMLLTNDFSDYNQFGGYGFSGNGNFSVMVGLKFSDKEKNAYKANPLLRLGFSYSSGTSFSKFFNQQERIPYDTLISTQTGNSTFIDSVNSKQYGMTYKSEQIRFDGSLIFRTNPEARWSVYTGIGLTAGISLNASTQISYNESSYIESMGDGYGNHNYGDFYFNADEREVIKNKTNFGMSVYVPIGIDFRIGKNREFWKRTHLFFELNPSINVNSIPELYTITTTDLQQRFGVRVNF